MSRRRKAVVRPIDAAIEAVVWRARIVCEDNGPLAIKRLQEAIEDYEVSRPSSRQGQLELQA
jgi:hypothetical protein